MKIGHLRASRRLSIAAASIALAAGALFAAAQPASAQPILTITSGPAEGSTVNLTRATFGLAATAPDGKAVDFFCSVDNEFLFHPCHAISYPSCVPAVGGGQSCTQSYSTGHLSAGAHVFRAFASDCDTGCEPAEVGSDGPMVARSFTVDRTAPVLSITGGPGVEQPLLRGLPSFSFSADEPVEFTCWIDGRPLGVCASPFAPQGVRNGTHVFKITGRDLAGNEAVAVEHAFAVDIFKPKRCKKGKSDKAKAKRRKCVKANARAKAKWKRKHGLR